MKISSVYALDACEQLQVLSIQDLLQQHSGTVLNKSVLNFRTAHNLLSLTMKSIFNFVVWYLFS